MRLMREGKRMDGNVNYHNMVWSEEYYDVWHFGWNTELLACDRILGAENGWQIDSL